jgi:tryptophan-rich sensory protein
MASSPPKHSWIGLIVLLVICFAAAGVGGAVTTPKIPGWSALYCCMAVAAWLVWRKGGLAGARLPLALFGVQLLLNVLWSCLFFGLQRPGLAFSEVLLLWASIAATMVLFWQRSTLAGMLFVPYLAWVSFASVLNFTIWRLNP